MKRKSGTITTRIFAVVLCGLLGVHCSPHQDDTGTFTLGPDEASQAYGQTATGGIAGGGGSPPTWPGAANVDQSKQFGDGVIALFRGTTIVAVVRAKPDPADPDKALEWFYTADTDDDWWTLIATTVPVPLANFPDGTPDEIARSASSCLGVNAPRAVTCSNRPSAINYLVHCTDTTVGAAEEWALVYNPTPDESSIVDWDSGLGTYIGAGAFNVRQPSGTRVAATAFRVNSSHAFQFIGAQSATLSTSEQFPFPMSSVCLYEFDPSVELWKMSGNDIKDELEPVFAGVNRYHHSDNGASSSRALTCTYDTPNAKWDCVSP